MTKQTIIIALIILGLAYYYWQKQTNTKSSATQQLAELTSQLNHWKSAYEQQEQVGIDYLTTHRATNFTELTEKISGQEQKITDLETALLNLAKQKIKGKKAAQQLLAQLETSWKNDKENWAIEKQELIKNHEQLITNYQQQEQHLLKKNEELAKKLTISQAKTKTNP